MKIATRCPSCRARLYAAKSILGRRLPCPRCERPFGVQPSATGEPSPAGGPNACPETDFDFDLGPEVRVYPAEL